MIFVGIDLPGDDFKILKSLLKSEGAKREIKRVGIDKIRYLKTKKYKLDYHFHAVNLN